MNTTASKSTPKCPSHVEPLIRVRCIGKDGTVFVDYFRCPKCGYRQSAGETS